MIEKLLERGCRPQGAASVKLMRRFGAPIASVGSSTIWTTVTSHAMKNGTSGPDAMLSQQSDPRGKGLHSIESVY